MSLNRLRDLYPGFDPALIATAGNSGPGLPRRQTADPLMLAVLELVDHAVQFGQVLERRATGDRDAGKQWAEAHDATRQMLAAVDRLLELAGRAH